MKNLLQGVLKMRKRLLRTVLSCVLCFCLVCLTSSCDLKRKANKGEESMVFTERQLQILTEYGLSNDYRELTDSQINDIMAIEDLMKYAENKYNIGVSFCSFTQASPLNKETVIVEIDGRKVSVSRKYVDGKFVYEDNYRIVFSTTTYETMIEDYFEVQGLKVSVIAEIFDIKNDSDDLLSNVNSSNFVFVPESMSRDDFENVAKNYANWYVGKLNGISNVTRFYLIRDVDLFEINRDTYQIAIENIASEKRIMCVISASGQITLN